MRRLFILLTFVLIACLTQTCEARKLALLVGVDSYVGVPKLKCCVNDMKALKEALMKIGFEEDDVQMLVTGASEFNDLPTKKNIERNISKIVTNAQPTDIVFLAFSGHGAQEGKNVYFCPPEVELDNLPGTCVSINKIMDILANKCKAKFKWMVVDACRNDPTQGPKGIGGKGLQVIPTPPAGIALFQSCAEGEESWEDRDSGNGYFTKNFAAALSGEADSNYDGKLTLFEVCQWTTAKTKEQVRKSQNKSQRPYFSGSVSDFTLAEDCILPRGQELVKEARKAMDKENYELAIQKYDEAIALCPRFDTWKQERNWAQKLLKSRAPVVQPSRITSPPAVVQPPVVTSPAQTPSGTLKEGDRKVETVNGVEFAFRWCPQGKFMMGNEDGVKHQVILTKGFWMMETEVTQKQWKAVMGTNPSYFKDDDLPMGDISWNDCQEFCKKCTLLGLPVQLPTEAQWEYACRAGTTGAYAGNLKEMAWYWDNCSRHVHPFRSKKPNAWGLYDMHGNVCEWCSDWFGDYPIESVTDPTGPSSGSVHVYRGGGWMSNAGGCQSGWRNCHGPIDRRDYLGFRVVLGQ